MPSPRKFRRRHRRVVRPQVVQYNFFYTVRERLRGRLVAVAARSFLVVLFGYLLNSCVG